MENKLKDGVYEIKLTPSNPFNGYLIIKTYGDVVKKRKLPSIEDCRLQEDEWDKEYLPRLNTQKASKTIRYTLEDAEGNVVASGTSRQLADKTGINPRNINNAANSNGMRKVIMKTLTGNLHLTVNKQPLCMA